MTPISQPTQVHIRDSARTVDIDWDDGHHSSFPWWYLRGFCPCAVCQGHSGGLHFIPTQVDAPPPELTRVDEVGRYALNIVWDTDHNTGIYTFTHLREMCPCGSCQKAHGAKHPAAQLDYADRQKLD